MEVQRFKVMRKPEEEKEKENPGQEFEEKIHGWPCDISVRGKIRAGENETTIHINFFPDEDFAKKTREKDPRFSAALQKVAGELIEAELDVSVSDSPFFWEVDAAKQAFCCRFEEVAAVCEYCSKERLVSAFEIHHSTDHGHIYFCNDQCEKDSKRKEAEDRREEEEQLKQGEEEEAAMAGECYRCGTPLEDQKCPKCGWNA
jgi:hypothetical protein